MDFRCRRNKVLKIAIWCLVFVLLLSIYKNSDLKKTIKSIEMMKESTSRSLAPSITDDVLKEQSKQIAKEIKYRGLVPSFADDGSIDVFTYTVKNKWQLNKTVCSNLQSRVDTVDFPKLFINTPEGRLYLYTLNPKKETIARVIVRDGKFEPHIDVVIRHFMEKDPNMGFVDVGGNIGVRSLQVSKAGWNSIAIEALEVNILRLCASVILNNLGSRQTIVHTALSDTNDFLNISLSDVGDQGLAFVDNPQVRKLKRRHNHKDGYTEIKKIYSATLDDLLSFPGFFPKFSKVFMKMDVEGFEHIVLAGGSKFFQKVNVTGIIMEWNWHITRPSALNITSRLKKWNFEPYMPKQLDKKLVLEDYRKWPNDVLWLPSN